MHKSVINTILSHTINEDFNPGMEVNAKVSAADRSTSLKMIMPYLSGTKGEDLLMSVVNLNARAFSAAWKAAGSAIKTKIEEKKAAVGAKSTKTTKSTKTIKPASKSTMVGKTKPKSTKITKGKKKVITSEYLFGE